MYLPDLVLNSPPELICYKQPQTNFAFYQFPSRNGIGELEFIGHSIGRAKNTLTALDKSPPKRGGEVSIA